MKQPVVLLSNMPVPYREQLHERVSQELNGKYVVLYCAKTEPGRHWNLPARKYTARFLKDYRLKWGRTVHFNVGVRSVLEELNPSVLIVAGFQPPMLQAMRWAAAHQTAFVPFTDGTLSSEAQLSWVHRAVRRWAFERAAAFLAASHGGVDLYRSYGVDSTRIFLSPLPVDRDRFVPKSDEHRAFDLLFVGQMIERKMPLFAVEVARQLALQLGSCSLRMVGTGPLLEDVRAKLGACDLRYQLDGFLQPTELPDAYASARLLLFPTRHDEWGVVANEAMACGTPVVTTSEAGAAGELVIHGSTGLVLPPVVETWVDEIARLLDQPEAIIRLQAAGLQAVENFTPEIAAEGLLASIEAALHS